MKSADIKILSTRQMIDSCREEAAQHRIDITYIPFIKVTQVNDASLNVFIKSLTEKNILAVFTSINSVKAVSEIVNKRPTWKIACISGQTTTVAKAFFGKEQIIIEGNDSKELAENIIAWKPVQPVVFFCGNMRMNHLPDLLTAANIQLQEKIVYHTTPVPVKVEEIYDGIAFFSPSAVDSFFRLNKVPDHVRIFAIGNTTANHIKIYTNKDVLCSHQPSQQSITERIINYYDQERSST